ncbi:hypothetical protein OIV83_003008 [Microbotryomycetes sp. JL201]|nr:hypothetical protein OIV83_003008 [Microbotryomycetes sp. JL201]
MQDSFVLVNHTHPAMVDDDDNVLGAGETDHALLTQLAPYFATITDPSMFAWSFDKVQRVKHHRQHGADGRLFIDELLQLIGIDGPSVYPPPSASALNNLLFQLLSSPSSLQAHCIIFYLVLADTRLASATRDGIPSQPLGAVDLGSAFARDFLLPTGFVRGIEGFFALDSGSYKRGVQALTDPHLTPDFVAKTFKVLGSALVDAHERASLVLSFWRLSGVAIDTVDEADIVVKALCDPLRKLGASEAWQLQRKWQSDDERSKLVRTLLSTCFGENHSLKPVPHHLKALLAQPFNAQENDWVNDFCLSSSSSNVSATLAVDWRLSKLIAESKPVDALKFWDQAKHTVPATDERTRLLKAVHLTLTEVERNALALEIEDFTVSVATSVAQPKAMPSLSNLTQPAWQQAPVTASPVLPRSLASVRSRPAAAPVLAKPADLPLSASPFLRREKPLVSSTDGSALGGVQKSIFKALKDGASPIKQSPARAAVSQASAPQLAGSPARSNGPVLLQNSSTSSLFGEARELTVAAETATSTPKSKPTLSGFGSVRMPASMDYGRALQRPLQGGEEEDVEMDQDSVADNGETDAFGWRVTQDPAVSKVLKQADVSPASHKDRQGSGALESVRARDTMSVKKRTVSRSAELSAKDKRRAVSTEPEDKPRAPGVRVSDTMASGTTKQEASGRKLPPGAFPDGNDIETGSEAEGASANEDDDADQAETHKSATTTRRTRTSADASEGTSAAKAKPRRTLRMSSTQPPVTPRPARSTVKRGGAGAIASADDTPRGSVRRSSRLRATQDDAQDDGGHDAMVSVAPKATKSARKTRSTKRVVDEDEED